MLKNKQTTLFDTAVEAGLSGTGRLHDLLIKMEGIDIWRIKNGGENLAINYSFYECPFGNMLMASAVKGISYRAFTENEE